MKKILSLTLAFMMILSFAAIPTAFAEYGHTLTITAYSTAPTAETQTAIEDSIKKLNDDEFCSVNEVDHFSEDGVAAFDEGAFTVSVPEGGHIDFAFSSAQKASPYLITGIGLWVNGGSHFKFKVESNYWANGDLGKGYLYWKTEYEGETKLVGAVNTINANHAGRDSYYYPIVFDESIANTNTVRVTITEICTDSVTTNADFTEVQIYNQDEDSMDNANATGLPNLFTKNLMRNKVVVKDTDTMYIADGNGGSVATQFANEASLWSPYAAGFAVSEVAVEDGYSVAFNFKNPYFYNKSASGTRKYSTGVWPAYVSSWNDKDNPYNDVAIVPDKEYNTGCWWMVDMLDVQQTINHIKLNLKSGKAKKVEIYSSNVRGTEFGTSAKSYSKRSENSGYKYNPSYPVLNGAFNDPIHDSWKLVTSVENENGVEEVYIHDAQPATLWMVKVTEYTDDLQLLPFDVYLKGEKSLPAIIENEKVEGELTPGATLTYSVDVENQTGAAKVFFALYENEKLASVTPENINLEATDEAGKYDTASVTYTIPATAEGQLSVKAFLFDSVGKLVPLTLPAELPVAES